MADKNHVVDYTVVAGDMDNIDGVSVAEGTAPSNINNAIREMARDISEFYQDTGGGISSGGAGGAYTLTTKDSVAAYVQGQMYCFEANHAMGNTVTATLNINAIGAKPLRKNVSIGLAENDIVANQLCVVAYEGTNDVFHLMTGSVDSGWTQIGKSVTAAATATIDFTAGIDGTFRLYKFVLNDVLPAVDGETFIARVNIGGVKSDAFYAYHTSASESGANTYVGTATGAGTAFALSTDVSGDADHGWSGVFYLPNPAGTVLEKNAWWDGSHPAADDANVTVRGSGRYRNSNAAITGIQFRFTGNTTSGTFTMYGLR